MGSHRQNQGTKADRHPQADHAHKRSPEGAIAGAVGMRQRWPGSLQISVVCLELEWESLAELAMQILERPVVVGTDNHAVAMPQHQGAIEIHHAGANSGLR